jgi:hypothetical protein
MSATRPITQEVSIMRWMRYALVALTALASLMALQSCSNNPTGVDFRDSNAVVGAQGNAKVNFYLFEERFAGDL